MISSVKKGGALVSALLATALCSAQQGQSVQVEVNGEAVTFPDVQPQKMGVVVMVPIRAVCEKLGATVAWNEGAQTVTCNSNGSDVTLQVGDSEATVNGQMRYLDLPPKVVNKRVLVPMRFLGDSIGNQVTWDANAGMVAITTGTSTSSSTSTSTSSEPTNPTTSNHQVIDINQDEVVPVTLDTPLSSTSSQVGDTFTATVVANGEGGYASIPAGTKLEGHVAAVEAMADGKPAILDLAFDKLDLPNGMTEPIDGSLVSLDDKYVMVGDDGVYTAQDNGKTFNRMVFAGFATEDGMLVGVMQTQPIDAATLEDVQADMETQITEDQKQPYDLTIPAGTEFGVRINRDDLINL